MGQVPRPRVGKFGHIYNIGPRISKKVKNVKKYGPKGVPDPENINDVNAIASILTLNIKYLSPSGIVSIRLSAQPRFRAYTHIFRLQTHRLTHRIRVI